MTGKHTDASANIPPAATLPDPEPSVETQRAELADTVAALAGKADVPTRIQNSAHAQIQKAKTFATDNPQIQKAKTFAEGNPQILAASAGSLGAALVLLIILRRRRSHRGVLR